MSLPTVKRSLLCISIVHNTIFIRLPGLCVAISPYNILSATFVPIHAFSESIKQLDVMLLSHTQHHGVLGVTQLQDSHLHVGNIPPLKNLKLRRMKLCWSGRRMRRKSFCLSQNPGKKGREHFKPDVWESHIVRPRIEWWSFTESLIRKIYKARNSTLHCSLFHGKTQHMPGYFDKEEGTLQQLLGGLQQNLRGAAV